MRQKGKVRVPSINAKQDGATPLYLAIQAGFRPNVVALLDASADPNVKGNDEYPLVTAIKKGDNAIVLELLKHKANPNCVHHPNNSAQKLSALDLAVRKSVSITKKLLKYNAQVKEYPGSSMLSRALNAEQWDLIAPLLEHKADVHMLASKETGCFVLHHAVLFSAPRLILERLLQAAGYGAAGLTPVDKQNLSPLHHAVQRSADELVDIFIDHCKKAPDKSVLSSVVNFAMGPDFFTPLHVAGALAKEHAIRTLLSAGAEVNARDAARATPLYQAVRAPLGRSGQLATIELLLEHRAAVVPDVLDAWCSQKYPGALKATRCSCLKCFSRIQRRVFRLLVDAGGDPSQSMCLQRALLAKNFGLAKYILRLYTSVGTQPRGYRVLSVSQVFWPCGNGDTILHTACIHGLTDVFKLLVPHITTERANKRGNEGNTPLHCALIHGREHMALHLIKLGAKTHVSNDRFRNPIDYCTREFAAVIEQSSQAFQRGLEAYLDRKTFSDVTIISQDGQTIYAHKVLLSVRCGFFTEVFRELDLMASDPIAAIAPPWQAISTKAGFGVMASMTSQDNTTHGDSKEDEKKTPEDETKHEEEEDESVSEPRTCVYLDLSWELLKLLLHFLYTDSLPEDPLYYHVPGDVVGGLSLEANDAPTEQTQAVAAGKKKEEEEEDKKEDNPYAARQKLSVLAKEVFHLPRLAALMACSDAASRLSSDISRALAEEMFPDLTIRVVGHQPREFRAHRLVLCTRSDYFRQMFSVDMMENQQRLLLIRTVPGDVFGMLLRYLYTGFVDPTPEGATMLLDLSQCYMIAELKRACIFALRSGVDPRNAIALYGIALLYESKDLEETALECMRNNFGVVAPALSNLPPHLPASRLLGGIAAHVLVDILGLLGDAEDYELFHPMAVADDAAPPQLSHWAVHAPRYISALSPRVARLEKHRQGNAQVVDACRDALEDFCGLALTTFQAMCVLPGYVQLFRYCLRAEEEYVLHRTRQSQNKDSKSTALLGGRPGGIDVRTNGGHNLVHAAVFAGRLDSLLELLLLKRSIVGPMLTAKDVSKCWTPLHWAVQYRHPRPIGAAEEEQAKASEETKETEAEQADEKAEPAQGGSHKQKDKKKARLSKKEREIKRIQKHRAVKRAAEEAQARQQRQALVEEHLKACGALDKDDSPVFKLNLDTEIETRRKVAMAFLLLDRCPELAGVKSVDGLTALQMAPERLHKALFARKDHHVHDSPLHAFFDPLNACGSAVPSSAVQPPKASKPAAAPAASSPVASADSDTSSSSGAADKRWKGKLRVRRRRKGKTGKAKGKAKNANTSGNSNNNSNSTPLSGTPARPPSTEEKDPVSALAGVTCRHHQDLVFVFAKEQNAGGWDFVFAHTSVVAARCPSLLPDHIEVAHGKRVVRMSDPNTTNANTISLAVFLHVMRFIYTQRVTFESMELEDDSTPSHDFSDMSPSVAAKFAVRAGNSIDAMTLLEVATMLQFKALESACDVFLQSPVGTMRVVGSRRHRMTAQDLVDEHLRSSKALASDLGRLATRCPRQQATAILRCRPNRLTRTSSRADINTDIFVDSNLLPWICPGLWRALTDDSKSSTHDAPSASPKHRQLALFSVPYAKDVVLVALRFAVSGKSGLYAILRRETLEHMHPKTEMKAFLLSVAALAARAEITYLEWKALALAWAWEDSAGKRVGKDNDDSKDDDEEEEDDDDEEDDHEHNGNDGGFAENKVADEVAHTGQHTSRSHPKHEWPDARPPPDEYWRPYMSAGAARPGATGGTADALTVDD